MTISKTIAISALVAGVMSAPAGHASTFKTLHTFTGGSDGWNPGQLIENGGILYGTAGSTGNCPSNCGIVFAFDPKTDVETVLYTFGGLLDGAGPGGTLAYANGLLYGATAGGGTSGGPSYGVVYSVNPSNGAETVLYRFAGGTDGDQPGASPIYLNGMLYGTTTGGGSENRGVIYQVNPSTGAEQVLHSFTGDNDGNFPEGVLAANGNIIYGTTLYRGPQQKGVGPGTIYSFDVTTNTETVLYAFQAGADAQYPLSGLIYAGGVLYGSTLGGGTGKGCASRRNPWGPGCGTVFSFNLTSNTETVVYSFAGRNGAQLGNGVVSMANGTLYTTSFYGGKGCGLKKGCGTIVSINPSTGAGKVLYNFTGGSDGSNPIAGILPIGKVFYGTAENGGTTGGGTLFQFKP